MLKRIVSFFMAAMLLTSVALAASFTDFGTDHWAYQYVDELVTSGVINGYEDGTYRPENNVTRAELAKLIVAQFGASGEKAYTDVAEADWFHQYVSVSGSYFLSEGEFFPANQATREEVAYAIYVAKKLTPAATPATFTDAASIDARYQEAVSAVFASGIITGYPDGTFLPKNNITRAEVATVLSRAIKLNAGTTQPTANNEELYREVFKMAKLTEFEYNANRTLSYGELSSAALRMFNNEYELAYYNLGDVVGKRPFEHKDALSFWLIGRDVLGAEIVTQEKIDTSITVAEAKKVMAFYAERHDLQKRTVDQSKLLANADQTAPLTCALFAQLITELDEQIPMLIKVVVTGGATADQPTTALRKDVASFPKNRSNYQAILEEVPNAVYEAPYALSTGALTGSYDFARELRSFLLNPINEFCQIAQANGASIKIHYYPSLVLGKNNVYTMRVKLEVVSANAGLTLKHICKTNVDRAIKAGDSFFCDLNTNEQVPSKTVSGATLSIDKIIE
ncbi:MAG: S-layer homology domain-containing protein [Clostridia bacterium]|nr:S-layer homology domain-containing protein [Clostridia bacterium]